MKNIFQTFGILCLLLGVYAQASAQCIPGATFSTRDGLTELFTCSEGSITDPITFKTSTLGTPFAYLITDNDDNIIEVSLSNTIDFSGLSNGAYRIWAFSFKGELLAQPGQNAQVDSLASVCFELTDNFIPLFNIPPAGGDVATADGATSVITCTNDGNADIIEFSTTSDSPVYSYLVTDENNEILAIVDGNSFDFDGAPVGTCRVWGLAYYGNLLAQVGDNAAEIELSDECFELSNNFIEVIRTQPDGGTVALEDGTTEAIVCVNDDVADVLTFNQTTSSLAPYTFVITDENNIILALSDGNTADFDGAGTGICRIWGLSFTGNITAQAGDDAAAIALTDECFDLSDNFITVIRQEVDGGTVNLSDGSTEITTCVNDGEPDVLVVENDATANENYTYVITDDNNLILNISDSNEIDFEGAGEGVCRIWGLAFTGDLTAQIGDNAAAVNLSDQCFELSENFITVTRKETDGGTVSLTDGSTSAIACVGDGLADELSFQNSLGATDGYQYVITDENNIILALPTGNTADFDGAGVGVCRVWGLSFTGNIIAQVGDDAAAVTLTDECFDLSDNFITVTRQEVDGATVSLADGSGEITICVGDGADDILSFSNTSTADALYSYIITDSDNSILAVSNEPDINFEGAGPGICRIWGLSYTGTLSANPGDIATEIAFSDECFELSSNFVLLNRKRIDAGTVSLEDGSNLATVCVSDGVGDVLTFSTTSNMEEDFVYLITDDNNIILGVATGNSQDFDAAGPGLCRVWGLAYSGNLTVTEGDDAATAMLSDECFDLSDNFIQVVRKEVEGGTLALDNGSTSTTICVNDGIDDILNFAAEGAVGESFRFIITDSENVVLAINEEGTANFEGAGEGVCRVWGLSYTGSLTVMVGDNAATETLSSECFDLSDNFIEVNRLGVQAGFVFLADNGGIEATVCVNDGEPDILVVENDANAQASYVYVITDENNIILNISETNEIDVEGAGEGVCRIWGLAFTGEITAQIGDDAAAVDLSDGCFELSQNFITVIRKETDAGTVSLTDGSTSITVCVGDGASDELSFQNSLGATEGYQYIITDENNIILALPDGNTADFDGAEAGTCRVWGLAFTGNITTLIGDDAAAIALSDECFDLSDNFITVERIQVNGGTVALSDGSTSLNICTNDGESDIVMVDATTDATESYVFVVTDGADEILTILSGNSVDLDVAPAGTCRIWGVSFSGNQTALIGQNINDVPFSDQCFDLSDNFIEIQRDVVMGGSVQTSAGETEIFTCPGDGIADLINFETTGTSSSAYAYLITDENNNILATSTDGSFDFDGAGEGICRVWGLAYSGDLTATVGENAATAELASLCFELSNNFITVTRSNPVGGTVATSLGETELFLCVGDGSGDIIEFASEGAEGANFTFVITDDNNLIISVLDGNSVDFNVAGLGTCRVWGLSYTGTLTAQIGDDAGVVDLSDGCFDLSSNFVTVNRDVPEAGTISSTGGVTEIELCVGDGIEDVVQFLVEGASISNYAYVITDENDVIIATLEEDSFNFDNAVGGNCRIYGISYTGILGGIPGDDLATANLSTDCFDLTDNYIQLIRTQVDGGILLSNFGSDEVFFCISDTEPDQIELSNTGLGSGGSYFYLLTDEDNIIIQAFNNPVIPFENMTGSFRIWGLNFTGNYTALVGDNVEETTFSDECFALTENFITVTTDDPMGGQVATDQGETALLLCIGAQNTVTMTTSSSSVSGYVYVVTDENNVILGLSESNVVDFTGAEPGICRVWGLSYTGSITAQVGDNAADVALSNSCFELSENFVEVYRSIEVDGGNLSTGNGEEIVYTCTTDDIEDLVVLFNDSQSEADYRYFITDESNIVIAQDVESSVIDFDPAEPGVYRIWGVSFTGEFLLTNDQDAATFMISDSCFDLSNNFITIVREDPEGGMVATTEGETEITVSVGDDIADEIAFTNEGASATPYIYVITDENNVILGFAEQMQDFEGAGEGVCRVWGLAYTGSLIASAGDDAAAVPLSDDCFDLSDNFVTVTRVSAGAPQEVGNPFEETINQLGTVQLAPNPVSNSLQINFEVLEENGSETMIRVFSANGQEIMLRQQATTEGLNRFEENIEHLQDGLYILFIQYGSESRQITFVKQS